MNQVERAIIEVKEGILPIERNMSLGELEQIKEITEKEFPGKPIDLVTAINNAYMFGFRMGFKHCEVENMEV